MKRRAASVVGAILARLVVALAGGSVAFACASTPERSSNAQLSGVYEAQLLACVARADTQPESQACRCDVMARWHQPPKPYCVADGGAP